MIITTTYTERLTITTDDAGHVTTTRTSSADTETAYRFDELTPEAQQRAINDAIEEEDRAYYHGEPCQMYFTEYEIIGAARDLEKSQPVDITQDQGCSWYGTARGTWWYHAADWQAVTEATDTGICWSMDICDAWNHYAARIIALQEAHEEATDQAAEFWSIESDAHGATWDTDDDAEKERLEAIADTAADGAAAFEAIAERIENAAEELTEDAARAVGDTVDGLIEAERDYYQSPEFWREWLSDSDDRYTRDGERI